MESLTPLYAARRLATLAGSADWAIGGSVLLQRFGLVERPRDLDIVTTPESFPAVSRAISAEWGPSVPAPHATFASRFFVRVLALPGMHIDVMAQIRVRRGTSLVSWHFDPNTVVKHDGLPWMSLQQWHELYLLFERPEKAQIIHAYLDQHGD